MSCLQLALYVGRPKGLMRLISHYVTCLVMTLRDGKSCPWSHVELVIDGLCHSSSAMDIMMSGPRQGKRGGMRIKRIDLENGKWDIVVIDPSTGLTAEDCEARFQARMAQSRGYDWPASIHWALPFVRPRERADNCLEAVGIALGHPRPSAVTFRDLTRWVQPSHCHQTSRHHG